MLLIIGGVSSRLPWEQSDQLDWLFPLGGIYPGLRCRGDRYPVNYVPYIARNRNLHVSPYCVQHYDGHHARR